MRLSTRSRYGLMAMEILKDYYDKEVVSVSAIAEEKNISTSYLEQLFSLMKKSKLVESTRGSQGGYRLTRPPEEITIGEILNALEGDLEFSCCEDDRMICHQKEACRTKEVLDRIESAIAGVTDSITLADL
ncbi:MAG: Rrf2 family transcriptional regulator [Tissierellia bacterium]|nr:Rrf2 family transcriptional regulator [Tissierellia bacterium]